MTNSNKTTEKPFSEVLTALFTNTIVPIHDLYRLSDMSAVETAEFQSRWPDVDAERRRVIARHMADLTEDNYVVEFSPVFGFMLDDPAAPVRVAALDGLWDSTNTGLISAITHLLQHDNSPEVRAAAAAALSHYVLMAEWGQLPRHYSARLVETLLVEYEKANTPLAVKRSALEAMGAANHPRVAELILAAYHSGDFETQLSAVFAMGSSADPRWLPTVLDEMENDEVTMQAEAARAAGIIGKEEAVPALARLVLSEELVVALTAVHALGQIGGDTSYRVLTTLIEDPEFENLHEAAGEALEELDWLGGNIGFGTFLDDVDDDDDYFEPDEDGDYLVYH
jgi:HEAT repeat protein